MATKLLDLDAVSNEVEFSLKLNGKTHEMVEPTVEDFIKTMKKLEDMPLNVTPRQELEMAIDMIVSVFPTVKRGDLTKLGLSKVRKISDFVRQASGQQVEVDQKEGEKKEGEGNVQAAS